MVTKNKTKKEHTCALCGDKFTGITHTTWPFIEPEFGYEVSCKECFDNHVAPAMTAMVKFLAKY